MMTIRLKVAGLSREACIQEGGEWNEREKMCEADIDVEQDGVSEIIGGISRESCYDKGGEWDADRGICLISK